MKIKSLVVVAVAALLAACSGGKTAKVEGQFFGYSSTFLLVEQTIPGGNSLLVDTLRTDTEGAFSFNVDFKDANPVFINIKTVDNYVPLLLSPGEKVKVSSIGNLYNNYTVEGSVGSETLRSLNMMTVAQIRALDSLAVIFNNTSDPAQSKQLGQEYSRKYIDLKRKVIRFVVTNPGSLASLVPLYQPMVAGRYIFDEPTDIVYFKAVADSLAVRYPDSPYVVSLLADVEQSNNAIASDSIFRATLENIEEMSVPPLDIKDAEGQMRKLSDLIGKKVILLDFTSITTPELKVRNREIAEVYEKYNKQGFEIYQVAIDDNRAAWLSAVVDARIKWISVNDFQGKNSKALAAYNVQKIPSCFLIDLKGNIVARDFNSVAELERSLKEVL